MEKKIFIREIYFYIVCLMALVIFIIGLVSIYDNGMNFAKPTTYLSRPSMLNMYKGQYPDLSKEQIDKLVEEEIATSLQTEKDIAFKGLFRGILLVVISVPIFIFHWEKAQMLWTKKNKI